MKGYVSARIHDELGAGAMVIHASEDCDMLDRSEPVEVDPDEEPGRSFSNCDICGGVA